MSTFFTIQLSFLPSALEMRRILSSFAAVESCKIEFRELQCRVFRSIPCRNIHFIRPSKQWDSAMSHVRLLHLEHVDSAEGGNV
jgi:hypothetical protein